MLNDKEKSNEKSAERKVRVMKIGVHRKAVIILWIILIASVCFGVYKNFTAVDTHTVHEKEIVQLRLNDTNGVESFVKDFALSYYTWDGSQESIDIRNEAMKDYMTKELCDLNIDTVRSDIPTSSTVVKVTIWNVEQSAENEFTVTYEVEQRITDQLILEGEKTKNVRSAYTVVVHVDKDEDMVIIKNPKLAAVTGRSEYEPEAAEIGTSIDPDVMSDASEFLKTFFKLYPSASEKELSYYVADGVLKPIKRAYIFSDLINPVFIADGDNVRVSVSVRFIDEQTRVMQISQFELVLKKDDNWKIVEAV